MTRIKALPGIAAAHGAEVIWQPMLLGGVFKATGNHSPAEIPAKSKWMHLDLQRWAARYGATFTRNPHFPINTMTIMRGAVGMQPRAGGEQDEDDGAEHALHGGISTPAGTGL